MIMPGGCAKEKGYMCAYPGKPGDRNSFLLDSILKECEARAIAVILP